MRGERISTFLCGLACAFCVNVADAQETNVYLELEGLLGEAQLERAIELVEPHLRASPNDARLHFILGKALIESVDEVSLFRKLSHARRGRESLERAIQLDPALIAARKELSDYYYYAPSIAGGSKARSAQILEEIRGVDPYSFFLFQGEYQSNGGEWLAAKRSYTQAHDLQPANSTALLQLGIANRQLQLYQEANDALQQALELNPEETLALFYLGLLGLSDEAFAAAGITALESYIELVSTTNERYLDQAHFRLGQLWQTQGDPTRAARNLRRAIALRPGYEAAQEALDALVPN